ncbi:MAG: AAA family ATPase, partial [Elusimicrobiota bacterium]
MKTKIIYRCRECGKESLRWLGQCDGCQAWNSLDTASSNASREKLKRQAQARDLDVHSTAALAAVAPSMARGPVTSGFPLFDEALGGGIFEGAFVLLGGAPGIGKSTLMAHLAAQWARARRSVLYASCEEETGQIAARLARLKVTPQDNLYVASSLTLEEILWKAEELRPALLIVDSVQTVDAESAGYPVGSPALVRLVALKMLALAKKSGITVILLGHVTKEGTLAGPKHLEHMVDVVMEMEKPRLEEFRTLRVVKNRFGAANGLVVFSMGVEGLTEVVDPSASFISKEWRERLGEQVKRSGFASSIAMDSGQPFLVQIEALVGAKRMAPGRRTALGLERNRMEMMLAVIEKTLGVSFECTDVFVSLVGGVRCKDTGIDLAQIVTLVSSFYDIPVPTDTVFLGEVSLSGDVLAPKDLAARVKQATSLGFTKILHPKKGFFMVGDFIRALKERTSKGDPKVVACLN